MDEAVGSVAEGRHTRRKAATRAAIVRAARDLLATDGADVSVQAITERADVALGSFYNHFDGKPAVFEAAAADALEEFEASLVARTQHLHGVLAVFAARMRLYGRMTDTHPSIAAVMTSQPPSSHLSPHGYSLRALADVEAAIATGELVVDDLDIRLIAAVGSLRGLIVLRRRDPSIGPERVDDMVSVLLEMFGMSRSDATALAHLPLDDLLAAAAPEATR